MKLERIVSILKHVYEIYLFMNFNFLADRGIGGMTVLLTARTKIVPSLIYRSSAPVALTSHTTSPLSTLACRLL